MAVIRIRWVITVIVGLYFVLLYKTTSFINTAYPPIQLDDINIRVLSTDLPSDFYESDQVPWEKELTVESVTNALMFWNYTKREESEYEKSSSSFCRTARRDQMGVFQ